MAESFGLVVFASQWPTNPELRPIKTHTFASFIHEKHDGNYESYVISWLPRSGIINGLIQPGSKFSLKKTLKWSFDGGMKVFGWHAFEMSEALFDSALRRISDLISGNNRYYLFGTGSRNFNCSHALSGLDIISAPDLPLALYGVDASRACLHRMKRWIWKSPNPEKYEMVLDLPLERIHWIKDGLVSTYGKMVNPSELLSNISKDLPTYQVRIE